MLAFQVEIAVELPNMGDVVATIYPREDDVWLVALTKDNSTSKMAMWIRGRIFHSGLSDLDRSALEQAVSRAVESARDVVR